MNSSVSTGRLAKQILLRESKQRLVCRPVSAKLPWYHTCTISGQGKKDCTTIGRRWKFSCTNLRSFSGMLRSIFKQANCLVLISGVNRQVLLQLTQWTHALRFSWIVRNGNASTAHQGEAGPPHRVRRRVLPGASPSKAFA